MFKRGILTDEVSQEIAEAIELAAKHGLDGLELRSVWDKGVHELEKHEIDAIRRMVSDASMEVCAISSPVFKCDLDDPDQYTEHIGILEKSIEAASEFGAGLIRCFAFWRSGDFGENLSRIVERFEEPVAMARRAGVVLVLESESSVNTTNAAKLRAVIDSVDSPNLRALWDPGNSIMDPDNEAPYPDGYEIIKDHMVHVHLKDIRKHSDGRIEMVPIGKGSVDFLGQFRALARDRYEGYVVLETHYRPSTVIPDELMTKPKGARFSYMGYSASDECLGLWKELMDAV